MIRFPEVIEPDRDPFSGTVLQDWIDAANVFDALSERADMQPDVTALTFVQTGDPGEEVRRVSYRELLASVAQAANLFRSLGVTRNDGVAYMLPALVETQFVLWGAETAGFAVPINFLLQPQQIAELMTAANVKVLIALGPVPNLDIWQKAIESCRLAGSVHAIVKLGGGPADHAGVIDFQSACQEQPGTLIFDDRPGRNDVAAYFHTGGTTGVPKLVTHTHENQLAAGYGSVYAGGLRASDIVSNGFPMFHVAGTIFCSLAVLLAGGEIVILSGGGFRNPNMVRNYWRIAEQQQLTVVGGIPTALAAVMQTSAKGFDLSRVRYCMSGGAALPRSVAQCLESMLQRPVREGLGMTESGGMISIDYHDRPRVIGSVGQPVPFCEVEVRRLEHGSTTGPAVAPREPGVFVLRGPNVTPGYRNPKHDVGSFTPDGWLITGDVGYRDEDGSLFITGRAKDVIIRSGHNIDPVMIEDAFLSHEDVAEAAAVSMPDAYAGELPIAYLVLKPGHRANVEELRAHAEARISERPAYPKRIFVLDSLPMTAVGKVFKPGLRNDCAQRLFAEVLDGEPIEALLVSESGSQGRVAGIRLGKSAEDPSIAMTRIRQKLEPYLVVVEWA